MFVTPAPGRGRRIVLAAPPALVLLGLIVNVDLTGAGFYDHLAGAPAVSARAQTSDGAAAGGAEAPTVYSPSDVRLSFINSAVRSVPPAWTGASAPTPGPAPGPGQAGDLSFAGLESVIRAAFSGLGHGYVWGGTSPQSGWDCSGFVQWAYLHAGIGLPRTEQWSVMRPTTAPQPGDLVVQNQDGPYHWEHVGIYVGEGQMISALNPEVGTVLLPTWATGTSRYFTLAGSGTGPVTDIPWQDQPVAAAPAHDVPAPAASAAPTPLEPKAPAPKPAAAPAKTPGPKPSPKPSPSPKPDPSPSPTPGPSPSPTPSPAPAPPPGDQEASQGPTAPPTPTPSPAPTSPTSPSTPAPTAPSTPTPAPPTPAPPVPTPPVPPTATGLVPSLAVAQKPADRIPSGAAELAAAGIAATSTRSLGSSGDLAYFAAQEGTGGICLLTVAADGSLQDSDCADLADFTEDGLKARDDAGRSLAWLVPAGWTAAQGLEPGWSAVSPNLLVREN